VKIQKWAVFFITLVLMAGTAVGLGWLKTHQKLGRPGIKGEAIPGSVQMKIDLPARVGEFTSTNMPEPEVVVGYLPRDTSYTERVYTAPDGFPVQAAIVLMGADRTSIHNAEYCLGGQGFSGQEKSVVNIPVAGEASCQLSAARWNVSGDFAQPDGQKIKRYGVYVFWFVTDGEETASHFRIMQRMALNLLHTGVLQRWAYVLYFAPCEHGQEDATFERMKNLIANSVAQYQFFPDDKEVATAVKN
jgi:Protein of unknown function (DUF3485)